MKKSNIFILILIIFLTFTNFDLYSNWTKNFSNPTQNEYLNGAFQIAPNVIITSGYSVDYDSNYNINFFQFDTLGNQINVKHIEMGSYFFLSGFTILNDSTGFIYSGNIEINNELNKRMVGFTLKVDLDGNEIWRKYYTEIPEHIFQKISTTNDDSFLIAGGLINNFTKLFNFLVIKIDVNGNIIWQKSYGTMGNEVAKRATQTKSGKIIIGGDSDGDYMLGIRYTYTSIWMVGLDENGDFLWQNRIGNGFAFGCQDHFLNNDNDIIVCGEGNIEEFGVFEFVVLKLNDVGELLTFHTYGGKETSDAAFSICQLMNGNYALVGYMNTISVFQQDFIYSLMDNNFNELKRKKITTEGRGQGFFVGNGLNGNLLLCGVQQKNLELESNLLSLIKNGDDLLTSIEKDDLENNILIDNIKPEIYIYPNPSSDFITFEYKYLINQIQIWDISGKLVKTIEVKSSNIENGIVTIYINDLERGNYFLTGRSTSKIEFNGNTQIKDLYYNINRFQKF